MNVAILMTCHNRCETTLGCLARLLSAFDAAADCSYKVFLVDDGSSDGTASAVSSRYPNVCVIKGDGNLFWAKGMNLAWRESLKDYDWDAYLWLNDDTVLREDSIAKVLSVDNGESIVVGELENVKGEIVYGVRKDGLFTGNCVLVPRRVYNRIGMICGEYSHAWADSDYAMQAKRTGITVVSAGVVGEAEGHENRPSLKGLSLGERWMMLFNPKGWNLHDLWLYRRRNWGVCVATASCVHLIFHVIMGER